MSHTSTRICTVWLSLSGGYDYSYIKSTVVKLRGDPAGWAVEPENYTKSPQYFVCIIYRRYLYGTVLVPGGSSYLYAAVPDEGVPRGAPCSYLYVYLYSYCTVPYLC